MERLAGRGGGELVGSCPSIHPSLTAVLSERSAKRRVGLHGSVGMKCQQDGLKPARAF